MQGPRRGEPSVHASSPPRLLEDRHADELVTNNAKMQALLTTIDKVADTDISVLIRGESGTGKGLVAHILHARSSRHTKPYVTVNCAAMPEALLESELFGYEKGAFTGALSRKLGKFEIAHTGTLFLDEIGDIHPGSQAKLLQVLQDGKFPRLGAGDEVNVDVRVIASTNRDLETAMQEGNFREDLFYRLNVISIFLPPLRERVEDMPLLMQHFLDRYNRQYDRHYGPLAPETLALFRQYHWPGNVRELENMMKRVIIMGAERFVREELSQKVTHDLGHARVEPSRKQPRHASLKQVTKLATQQVEKELLKQVLNQTHWNRKAAAKLLNISYRSMLHKIRLYNLTQPFTGGE